MVELHVGLKNFRTTEKSQPWLIVVTLTLAFFDCLSWSVSHFARAGAIVVCAILATSIFDNLKWQIPHDFIKKRFVSKNEQFI